MSLTPIFEELCQENLDSGLAHPLADLTDGNSATNGAAPESPVQDQAELDDETEADDEADDEAGAQDGQQAEQEDGSRASQPGSPWVVPDERVA